MSDGPIYDGVFEIVSYAGNAVCAPYSASYTYYAQQNYATCSVEVCGGETVVASGCSSQGGSCSGNQYLRLLAPAGGALVGNDGFCGSCALISYSVPSGAACQNYTIAQGCNYYYSCGGTTAVQIVSAAAAAQGEAECAKTTSPNPTRPELSNGHRQPSTVGRCRSASCETFSGCLVCDPWLLVSDCAC